MLDGMMLNEVEYATIVLALTIAGMTVCDGLEPPKLVGNTKEKFLRNSKDIFDRLSAGAIH
jgi:hypothetical protein